MQDKPNVLIVDDKPENIIILDKILSDFNIEIVPAYSGNEALAKLLKYDFALALIDVQMPDMDGYETLEIMRGDSKTEHLPVIFISAVYQSDFHIKKGIMTGAVDFLTKPIIPDILRGKVSVFLELYKERMAVEEKNLALQHAYYTDNLTSLPNRFKLKEDIDSINPGSLILINIDYFRSVNTALGQEAGDICLKEAANRLNDNINDSGKLYRLASDEFVIIPKNNNREELEALCDNIQNCFNTPFIYQDVEIYLTVCQGITTNSSGNILKNADQALLDARQMGASSKAFFNTNPLISERYRNNIYWANKVKQALKDGNIIPFFQGVHNNKTGKIDNYECLVRLIDDDKPIEPAYFLEAAKKVGLMPKLTACMLEKSFDYFEQKNKSFSINLTSADLLFDETYNLIISLIKNSHIDPSNITFEILESITAEESVLIRDRLVKLKTMGCKIAVDDFGTAYSNFSRLMDYQVDYIKIDGKFIKDIDKNSKCHKTAQMITEFAHTIKAEVIAEYVYSEDVQKIVKELGIDHSQGFYFSKPDKIIKK